MRKILTHVLFIVIAILIIFGTAFLYTNKFWINLISGQVDTITSASVIIERPKGDYIILINTNFHKEKEVLEDWCDFFSAKEVSFIFEDISCSIATGDSGATKMAESFRSRLPENQMKIKDENTVLLASRVEENLFDIVIMSQEFIELNDIKLSSKNVKIIQINDEDLE